MPVLLVLLAIAGIQGHSLPVLGWLEAPGIREQIMPLPNDTQGGLKGPWAASSSSLMSVWEQIHLERAGLGYHRAVWTRTASMGTRAVVHHREGQKHRAGVPILHT